MRACDITPDDIVPILAKVHNRGSEVQANRVRTCLHAAFNFGSKSDYDHTRVGEKRFHLTGNPVSMTKKNTSVERSSVRVLNHSELNELWHKLPEAWGVGVIPALLVRFLIATAGQRPTQLLTAKWTDYDFDRNCVTFMNRKRNGEPMPHVVPLTPRAISILEEVKAYTSQFPWPFATCNETAIHPDSLVRLFSQWHRHRVKQAEIKARKTGLNLQPEKYTVKSIRDTAKSLMIDAGVDRETRNLIQSHQLTGVDYEHYDRHEHLPEKVAGITRYDQILEKILYGETGKVIDLNSHLAKTG